jgi:hypothetical protein
VEARAPDIGPRVGERGSSPLATLASVAGIVLALAFALERWPGARTAPSFREAMAIAPGTVVFVSGAAVVREDEVVLGPGTVELLTRAGEPITSLRATVGGEGVLGVRGLASLVLRPTGALVDLPFIPYHEVRGRDGRVAVFAHTTLATDGQAILRFGEGPVTPPPAIGPGAEPDAVPGEGMEPGGAPLR